MIAILLAVQLLAHPDPVLTPGLVRPLNGGQVCGTVWGRDRRHVTLAMRRHVFASYGISWSARRSYEVDHLVPRELGGADDVRNLWPQLWPEAHVKDRVENALHRAVCEGSRTLADAQAQMRAWGR